MSYDHYIEVSQLALGRKTLLDIIPVAPKLLILPVRLPETVNEWVILNKLTVNVSKIE